jgi:MoxR-like ATPase
MPDDADDVAWFAEQFALLHKSIDGFMVGQSALVHLALVCLFTEGHLLVEGVPGVGKTSLMKALAASISGTASRIQFSPDLLPADVTGMSVWRPDRGDFEFRPGPVFANVVLADEINRASPRTQSALLEPMEEHQVTAGGSTRAVPRPFLVIATRNPTEPAGTYELPDAQLDRFTMGLSPGYPDPDAEVAIIQQRLAGRVPELVDRVVDTATVRAMVAATGAVHVSPVLVRYCVELCTASRQLDEVRLGASPRAGLALARCARVHAAAGGRLFATADDIKVVAPGVLGHRLRLTTGAELDGVPPAALVERLLRGVAVPTGHR